MGTAEIIREIEYAPWPSQQRFHDCGKRYKGFSGPVGSGKSLALVHEAIRLSVVNYGRTGLIGAPTYPMLRDSTQVAFFDVLGESEIPYEFHKQENRLTFTELGSSVIFRSLDNPERLRGTNLAWFGIDEMTYSQEAAFLRLQARLRDPLARELVGYGVWTPKGFDWVYKRFIEDPGADYQAIIAQPNENKALRSDFYDELAKSYDEKFYRQEVLGEYLSIFSGRTYYAFDRATNVRPCTYIPNGEICWSLDFNVNPMCSVIAQIIDLSTRADVMMNRRELIVEALDEICLPDANINEACEEFKRRTEKWTQGRQLVVHLYGDPAGNSRSHGGKTDWQIVKEFFARFGQYKLISHVANSHNPVKDRVNAVNSALCNAAGERRHFVDPKCKDLIRDLEQVAWKADTHGNLTADLDKSNPKLTHISDADGYLIESVLGLKAAGGYKTGVIA